MYVVQLKLYTYSNGSEITTLFTFDPLTGRDSYDYDRESTRSASRRLRRRPYARQEVRTLTLASGFLLNETNLRNLKRLFDAHRIQWLRTVGGKPVWVDYDLDAEESMEFERVEDIDPLRRITFKLVQSNATWYTDFENTAVDIAF
jgi:hypothetical protein